MSARQPGKGYQGGGGGGGGDKGGGGGGGRGRGGQGHYQGGGGGGQRGGHGGGGGQRGGYGGGRDSKLSVIKWGTEKLKCEEAPGKVPCGWKHDMELPTTDNEIKALMPKLQPGKLKETDVKIETNHFEMKLSPPKDLFRYEVDIQKERGPREEAPSSSKEVKKGKPKAGGGGSGDGDGQPQRELKVNRDIMKKIMIFLVNKLKTDWEGKNKGTKIAIIHDFSRILISTKSLDPSVPLNYELKHSELPGEDGENCVYKIKLTHAQFNVDMERLTELIRSRDYNNPEMVEWKQIYNILMKNLGDQTYVTVGRSNLMKISPPTDTNQLGWGMMNWSGVSAICTLGATWKPFLNIEIQNCAFLIGQPVLETIAQIFADWKGNPNMQKARDVTQWKPIDHENVASILISCKVRRFVNRTPQDKKVTGIHRLPPSKVMFQFMNKNMSVADYFATYRGGPLQYPNGPVLMLGPKTFVPAECLTIREWQSINRILSGQPQKTMLKLCTQDPIVKHRNIHQKMKDMNVLKNPMLAEFGVSLPNANMLELNTRVLKAPELQYGLKSGEESGGRGRVIPTDGTWEMWDHPVQFYRPALIEAWAVVTVGVSSSHVNFVQMMRDKGRARGLMFPEPNCVTAVTIGWQDLHDDAVGRLTKTFSQIKSSFGAKQRCFILCVIPKKPSFQYNQVKQAAEREGNAGVLTQCLQVGNCETPKPAVVNNVLLKVNAKLGGINHVPIINHSLLSKINILQFPTLILGMDVNHPSVAIRGSPTGNPSYASVTGSLDRTGMPYMMHVQAQLRDGGTRAIGAAEVIANLDTIVKEMMMKFREVAGCQPGRIIVFRDGVGESQFPEVLQTEMMAIRKACTSLHKTYKPPITFVAVQKRHKVRFFRKEGSSVPMGRSGNVPPGTVVDTEIVQNSDFYLLSHSGLLGTSRPTHYHVLWDDSDFSMDDIQGLAYHLCYAYSRCNRSVSYPAPTYYAHWAASRAKGLADGNRDWEGDQRSLDRLNARIKRDAGFQKNFPMHFI